MAAWSIQKNAIIVNTAFSPEIKGCGPINLLLASISQPISAAELCLKGLPFFWYALAHNKKICKVISKLPLTYFPTFWNACRAADKVSGGWYFATCKWKHPRVFLHCLHTQTWYSVIYTKNNGLLEAGQRWGVCLAHKVLLPFLFLVSKL